MLPTLGFFKDIECPYHDSSCGRPYCHFRHRKKNQDSVEEVPKAPPPSEVPVYKPTPKSQLANSRSHIPISYVPDMVIRSDRVVRSLPPFKPTYKPTPISMLANKQKPSTSQGEDDQQDSIRDAKEVSNRVREDINFEDLSTEFDMIDEILTEDSESTHNINEAEPDMDVSDILGGMAGNADSFDKIHEHDKESSYETNLQTKAEELNSKGESDLDRGECVSSEKRKRERDKSEGKTEDRSNSKEKGKDKKHDKHEKSEKNSKNSKHSKNDQGSSKSEKHSSKSEKHSSKSYKNDHKSDRHKSDKDSSRSSSKNEKHSGKSDKQKSERGRSKECLNGSQNERHKRHSNEEKTRKSTDADDQSKESLDENTFKHENKHKKHDSRKHKLVDEKTRSESKDSKNSNSNKSDKSKKNDRNDKEHHRSDKEEKSDKNSKFSDKKHKSDKRKETRRDKERKIDKVSKADKDKRSESEAKEKIKFNTVSKSSSDDDLGNDLTDYTNSNDFKDDKFNEEFDMEDTIEDEDIEAECFRIYNEYKPEIPKYVPQDINQPNKTEESDIQYIPTKKRVAYNNADNIPSKITHEKPKTLQNPAVIMANRLKLAKQAQANREQTDLLNEVNKSLKVGLKPLSETTLKTKINEMRGIKRSIENNLEIESKLKKLTEPEKKPYTNNMSVIDSILTETKKPVNIYSIKQPTFPLSKNRRIAPVSNVNSLQMAKAKLQEVKVKQAAVSKTVTQTLGKGTKRVAHIPEVSLSDLPDVQDADKSKLPVNVRSRYLVTIAEECVKLYLIKDEAYERAVSEEYKCYERCSALLTYRNSAMLCVNRLRKELREREEAGLGPIFSGEPLNKDATSDFKGKRFYDHIKKWVLSGTDLEENGYPREGSTHGKATVKSNKPNTKMPLEHNQRVCCRCMKVYIVDSEGIALYSEECIYHPLRKRTLRGERTYLCCKSSDDMGCVTSSTHVCELCDDRELEGFQTTLEPEYDEDPRSHAVYALDCEMCYTTKGLELTRVTVVDSECKTIYESLVKPINPIVDYNTRFSGITKEHMDRTSTSILQVQANILHLCNSKTILIGHSLESDMKALKIIHSTIIDTALLFPHKMGLPHKRALRNLASDYLKKIIQNDINGHDSAEDAITCMELILWKLKEELKVRTKVT